MNEQTTTKIRQNGRRHRVLFAPTARYTIYGDSAFALQCMGECVQSKQSSATIGKDDIAHTKHKHDLLKWYVPKLHINALGLIRATTHGGQIEMGIQ